MSGISETFGSPPYLYTMAGGKVLRFRRMLCDDWADLVEKWRAELLQRENEKINRELAKADANARAHARFIAEEHVAEMTEFRKVLAYCTRDVKGIQRMLRYALLDEDWDAVKGQIPPMDMDIIAEQIAYLPVVKIENPSSPGGSQSETGTAGQEESGSRNRTGDTSPESSSTCSAATPAS